MVMSLILTRCIRDFEKSNATYHEKLLLIICYFIIYYFILYILIIICHLNSTFFIIIFQCLTFFFFFCKIESWIITNFLKQECCEKLLVDSLVTKAYN